MDMIPVGIDICCEEMSFKESYSVAEIVLLHKLLMIVEMQNVL